MPRSTLPVILAIFPNARGFGYSCMEGPQSILDSGIITVRPICNSTSLKKMQRIISYFEPTLIVVDNPDCPIARRSDRVKALINSLITYAQNRNLKVAMYSREQIRYVFSEFQAKTKHEVAQTLVRWFPELKEKAPQERKLWDNESYHMGLFDSLSLAVTHFYLKD